MDNKTEKKYLKENLDEQKNPEDIKKFIEDVELLGGHDDLVEEARQRYTKVVEEAGGNSGELDKRTLEVDGEISAINEETKKEIGEIESLPTTEVAVEVPPDSPNVDIKLDEEKQKIEKIKKLDEDMDVLFNQLASSLPGQIKNFVDSPEYKKLLELNQKRNVEEKSLFEIYERYTKLNPEHHRGFSTQNFDNYGSQYEEDMKYAGASEDTLKRFKNFVEKFRKPELEARKDYDDTYTRDINTPKWNFENELKAKSGEIFGEDRYAADEYNGKYYNLYQEKFSEAQKKIIPDKELYINTVGTIYS